MKKFVFSLMFAAAVLLAGSAAMAAVQTYSSKVAKFSVDIPDGWSGKAISDGCQIDSADGKNAMTVQFFQPNALSAMEFAKKMAEALKMEISDENAEDSAAFLDGKINGQPWAILVVKTPNVVNVATFGGPDRETMTKKIYPTVKDSN